MISLKRERQSEPVQASAHEAVPLLGAGEVAGVGVVAGVGEVAPHIREARTKIAEGSTFHEALAGSTPSVVAARGVAHAGFSLRSALTGAGPFLQPLLDDPGVTDILVNGMHGVWVDKGAGLEPVNELAEAFTHERDVRDLAVRLAAVAGRRLDDQSPMVDGTIMGGVRLHAVLPPLSPVGTLISLRTHRRMAYDLCDLESAGMLPPQSRGILDATISSRANVIISGATGSGKTTLLAAMLGTVPHDERILIIEESSELQPRHPHVVHLQERRANIQGSGTVSMSDLVRAAMRMRPDRIVLGECRGAEVRDVLTALNTGHEGGWATIHANSAMDVPARLAALGALAGMDEMALAAQASSAIDAVIHLERRDGVRRIAHIATMERDGGELRAATAIRWTGTGVEQGPGWDRLARRIWRQEAA